MPKSTIKTFKVSMVDKKPVIVPVFEPFTISVLGPSVADTTMMQETANRLRKELCRGHERLKHDGEVG